MYGNVPQTIVDDQEDILRSIHQNSEAVRWFVFNINNVQMYLVFYFIVIFYIFDLFTFYQQSEQETCTKAYKQYSKSRPAPSPESVKRMKDMSMTSLNCHPLLGMLHDVTEYIIIPEV